MTDINDIWNVEAIRQRLGLDENDTSRDSYILEMSPMERVRLIVGWYHGSEYWADTYVGYFESQGIYLTTDPGANGIIELD